MKLIKGLYKYLVYIIYLVGFLAIGIFVGYSMSKMKTNNFIQIYFIVLFILYITYFIHIILHEAGHLIGGLLSGYKFNSFRIGSFVLIKDYKNKFKIKRFNIVDTAGQCLMIPPSLDCPDKLYHLSGGLVNLLISLISVVLYYFINSNDIIINTLLFSLIIVGIVFGLTNLIPLKIGNISNDGLNALQLNKDKTSKKYINLTLQADGYFNSVYDYNDISESFKNKFKDIDFNDLDLTNVGICNALTNAFSFYFYDGDYNKCKELGELLLNTNDVLDIFKYEIKCDLLYLELINDCDETIINNLYDKKLQKYVLSTLLYPSRQRLLFAYHYFYKNDIDEANKNYNKLLKLQSKYVSQCIAKKELQIVDDLRTKQC